MFTNRKQHNTNRNSYRDYNQEGGSGHYNQKSYDRNKPPRSQNYHNNSNYNNYNNEGQNYNNNRNYNNRNYDNYNNNSGYNNNRANNNNSYQQQQRYGSGQYNRRSYQQQEGDGYGNYRQQQRYGNQRYDDDSSAGAGAGAGGNVKNQWQKNGENVVEIGKETVSYMRRIGNAAEKNPFKSESEVIEFVDSVLYDITNGDGGKNEFCGILNDFRCYKTIRNIVNIATEKQIRKLLHHCLENIYPLATGRHSSFVIQSLLEKAALLVGAETSATVPSDESTTDMEADAAEGEEEGQQGDDSTEANTETAAKTSTESSAEADDVPKMSQLLTSVCEELDGQWSRLMMDKAGTHPFRTLLTTLAAINKRELIEQICSEVIRNTDLNLIIFSSNTAPSISTMLEVLGNQSETYARVVDVITKGRDLNRLVEDKVASHVFETLLKTVGDELFEEVLRTVFLLDTNATETGAGEKKNRIAELSLITSSSFAVQQLIANVRSKAQLQLIFDRLRDSFPKIHKANTKGVLIKLAEACAKFEVKQDEFVRAIIGIFKSEEAQPAATQQRTEDELQQNQFMTIIALPPHIRTYTNKYDIFYTKVMIEILKFKSAQALKPIVSGLDKLTSDELFEMCTDQQASKVIEALIAAPAKSIPERIKSDVFSRLRTRFVQIVSDKYGSRVIELCLQIAPIDIKEMIGHELLQREDEVVNNAYGRIVYFKSNVQKFKQRDWREKEQAVQRKRAMFEDFDIDSMFIQKQKQPLAANQKPKRVGGISGLQSFIEQPIQQQQQPDAAVSASKDEKKKRKIQLLDDSLAAAVLSTPAANEPAVAVEEPEKKKKRKKSSDDAEKSESREAKKQRKEQRKLEKQAKKAAAASAGNIEAAEDAAAAAISDIFSVLTAKPEKKKSKKEKKK